MEDSDIKIFGAQPKPDEEPGGDQIPEGPGGSVATGYQILSAPIGQKEGDRGLPGGFFPHFWAAKNGAAGGMPGYRAG